MIGKRFIDGDKLVEGLGNGDSADAPELAGWVAKWLKRRPRSPQLVNRQGAAKILGRSSEHMARLKDRLPEPVKVEGGSWPVYLKSEIEALAKELQAERAKQNGSKKEKVSA